METYRVNSRVQDLDGFRGTVRYVGPVAAAKNQQELWLGVEWDDKTRGKHDGSCQDSAGVTHRYFQCAQGAGSFVKPGKVFFGKAFMESLKDRYKDVNAPEDVPGAVVPDAFVITASGAQKKIEFVGEMKIRKWQQLDMLNKVSMRNSSVSTAGDDLGSLIGHVIEVDLQDNLIWSWREVAHVSAQLPVLETILLHGNKLEPFTPEIALSLPSNCFSTLRVVALNHCGIQSWADVALLAKHMPSVEELYLAANSFGDMDSNGPDADSASDFQYLRILDVAACGISQWDQVRKWATLPALEDLVLDGNTGLSAIKPKAGAEANDFNSLRRLSLSSTGISTWADVDAIATYPGIDFVRLAHIPLFAGKGASDMRRLVIARLPALTLFNGSGVTAKDRRIAEQSYVRMIRSERLQLGEACTDEEFLGKHPRYTELLEKYADDLSTMATGAEGGGSIGADMLTVVINNMGFSSASGKPSEPVAKKLPGSLTIGRLKLMVKQLFDVDPAAQQLSVQSDKSAPPMLLDDDDATLYYYGVSEGSHIYVNECDVA